MQSLLALSENQIPVLFYIEFKKKWSQQQVDLITSL